MITILSAWSSFDHWRDCPKTFPDDLSRDTRREAMTMSFFGKLKNLHSGPPAPPRRTGSEVDSLSLPLFTDDNTGWPQDEFDDEEGDMYEAPPCERPTVKVPQRQVQQNVYLERTPSPAVPQRQAAPPPPRAGKPAGTTAHSVGAPEIDRSEKPGRKKMVPPPPACSVPAPSLVSNVEEDVYLDPNEEQEDNDDLYLEPTAACPPVHRGQQTRIPPCHKTIIAPSPTPMAKPPVPRAKSNSLLPLVNETKPAPPLELRQATLPVKIPPPIPSYKPPLPANLREAKSNPPNPPITDNKAAASSCVRPVKHSGHENKVWFAGDCTRKTAEEFLLRVNKDGAFLIRRSSNQSPRQPYTLAVLYQQKVYNVPIRFLEEVPGYALGKEGKKNEEVFSNLDEMISHHKHNQLLLIDSKSQAKHRAYLTHPAHP